MDVNTSRSISSNDFALAGPDTIGGQFLRRFWQPVYVADRLPPGQAVPIHIMGEDFTLFRGETGVAHVVANRCAHRSTQLSTGWVTGDAIRCLYHGWTYDGAGACIERPGEAPSGPCPAMNIAAYPTQEHMGQIYAYFGTGTPPAFPPFPAFDAGGIIETDVHEFPCNWFQTYENHADEAHLAFVHSTGGSHRALGREVELPQMSAEETDYGMVRLTRTSKNTQMRSTLLIFPNTMRIIIPPFSGYGTVGGWRDSYLTVVPTDDETHLLFLTQQAHVPDSELELYWETRRRYEANVKASRPITEITADILAGKLRFADVREHPLFLLIEDAVAQRGQGPIVDRTQEHLGATDVCIVRLRRLFERELKALAEGTPSKRWTYDGKPPNRGF